MYVDYCLSKNENIFQGVGDWFGQFGSNLKGWLTSGTWGGPQGYRAAGQMWQLEKDQQRDMPLVKDLHAKTRNVLNLMYQFGIEPDQNFLTFVKEFRKLRDSMYSNKPYEPQAEQPSETKPETTNKDDKKPPETNKSAEDSGLTSSLAAPGGQQVTLTGISQTGDTSFQSATQGYGDGKNPASQIQASSTPNISFQSTTPPARPGQAPPQKPQQATTAPATGKVTA